MTLMGAILSWFVGISMLVLYLNLPDFIASNTLYNYLFLIFPFLMFTIGAVIAIRD